MPMLESVLRLKQIRRTQKLQELARSNAELERCSLQCTLARQREDDARAALWQSMTTEDSLCVQRMTLARAQDAVARAAFEQATRARDACARENSALADSLARLEKEAEKLSERVDRQRLEEVRHAQRLEWSAIDESVVNRPGASR